MRMKPRKALSRIEPLLRAPSFTSKEARARAVSSAVLAYYVNTGEIQRIGHGIYRGAHAQGSTDFRWEDLVEAVRRVRGGVVCLVSALSLYGLTEEIPRQHWIAIRNETVHRGQAATRVVRMRNIELGKTKIDVGGVSVPIFDRERTIVDAFRFLSVEVAVKALKAALGKPKAEKLDIVRLGKYAKMLRVKIEPYLLAVTV